VSLEGFQSALARLVTDSGDPGTDGAALTDRERARLRAIAGSPGLAITRKLHRGFRLGKLLSMLPLTCACLGDDPLATQAQAFWRARPSRSFYFWEEALAFCEFLLAPDGLAASAQASPLLEPVVQHERLALLLQCAPERLPGACDAVLWPVDPRPVLHALAEGQALAPALPRPHLMVGERSPEGAVVWSLRA
jgi:hypothetical protein